MEYTEFTGKTVEEAVEKGLAELGITAEQADIRPRVSDGHIAAFGQTAVTGGIEAGGAAFGGKFGITVPVTLVDNDHIAGQAGGTHQRVIALVHTGHENFQSHTRSFLAYQKKYFFAPWKA